MNQSTVIDVPVTRATQVMPALQVIDQLQEVQKAVTPQMLPALIEQQFSWFSQQNQQVALEHVEAAQLADRMCLFYQVKAHLAALVKYVTKDVAERACDLAAQQVGYQGSCIYQAVPLGQSVSFTVPISTNSQENTRTEWVYQPVEQFTKLMPLRALQAMVMLEEVGLAPSAYWVADKVETKIVTHDSPVRRSLDPLLYARYGHWFAAIAEWV